MLASLNTRFAACFVDKLLHRRHPHLVIDKHPTCKEVKSGPPPPSAHALAPWALHLRSRDSSREHQPLQVIQALQQCHAAHPYAKFWGVCNDQKFALDRCFAAEKVANRCAVAIVQSSVDRLQQVLLSRLLGLHMQQ